MFLILRCPFFCVGTIIIQQAFSEPDSQYPVSRSSNSSLHSSALEAELSVSVPVKGIIDQRDYDSDSNFTDDLASLAVCVGFDYIKINHNTVSVAMKECFNDSIRYASLRIFLLINNVITLLTLSTLVPQGYSVCVCVCVSLVRFFQTVTNRPRSSTSSTRQGIKV